MLVRSGETVSLSAPNDSRSKYKQSVNPQFQDTLLVKGDTDILSDQSNCYRIFVDSEGIKEIFLGTEDAYRKRRLITFEVKQLDYHSNYSLTYTISNRRISREIYRSSFTNCNGGGAGFFLSQNEVYLAKANGMIAVTAEKQYSMEGVLRANQKKDFSTIQFYAKKKLTGDELKGILDFQISFLQDGISFLFNRQGVEYSYP